MENERLLEFAGELKNNGFKVYAPANMTTYFHFVKDDKIGYVEDANTSGFNFGTVHKPCGECGTGFGMYRDEPNPTIKMAEDCLVIAPFWASPTDIKAVKKYKNWEDYTSHPNNKWSPQVEL